MGASYSVTRWPVVPARIIHSSVEPASGNRFRPRVEYELYLAGRRYVGAGITRPGTVSDPSVPRFSRERAESIAALYQPGLELLAGYDPVNPSRTVLRPRFNWWTAFPVLMGGLLSALGVIVWRRNRTVTPVPAS